MWCVAVRWEQSRVTGKGREEGTRFALWVEKIKERKVLLIGVVALLLELNKDEWLLSLPSSNF